MTTLKKRRVEEDTGTKPLKCGFYLEKKKRNCSLQKMPNLEYCAEHMNHLNSSQSTTTKGERVPCPLDNKHSVWVKDLARHMKKCNAKPKELLDPWFNKDTNVKLKSDTSETVPEFKGDSTKDKTLYEKYIPILEKIKFSPMETRKLKHPSMDVQVEALQNQKHIVQQSSLVGNMKQNGMLGLDKFYVEFGCGKADLSKWVNHCALADGCKKPEELESEKDIPLKNLHEKSPIYGYGMIDRGVNRMKMDSKLAKDCEDAGVSVTMRRSRIDIKDLDLDKFLQPEPNNVVCISKHLCGAATDLTLKCLLNSSVFENGTFGGLLIAMCCRHACSYEQLLLESREYLTQQGFPDAEAFHMLKKMVSWALCGQRGTKKEEADADQDQTEKHVVDSNSSTDADHISGKTYAEREAIGFQARRLIDQSRVHALQMLLPSYQIDMFCYSETSTTLENVSLCAKLREISPT